MPDNSMCLLTAVHRFGFTCWVKRCSKTMENQQAYISQFDSFYMSCRRLFPFGYQQKEWQSTIWCWAFCCCVFNRSRRRSSPGEYRNKWNISHGCLVLFVLIAAVGAFFCMGNIKKYRIDDFCFVLSCKRRWHMPTVLPAAHMLCFGMRLYIDM